MRISDWSSDVCSSDLDETGSAQCSVTKTALPRAQTSPYGAHRVTKRVSCVLNCIRSVVMVGSLFGGSLKVSPKDVPVAQFDPQQTGDRKSTRLNSSH